MKPSPEEFESLQKLLRLKRYEQPTPRYFNEFSGRVIARIQSGEARVAPHWWQRFGIDLRPILTAGGAMVALGLLFMSVGFSFDNEGRPITTDELASKVVSHETTAIAATDSSTDSSTNPVVNGAGTMFDSFRPQVLPASFQLSH
jgi:hypothetical protein